MMRMHAAPAPRLTAEAEDLSYMTRLGGRAQRDIRRALIDASMPKSAAPLP
jgi:hypothetical protein